MEIDISNNLIEVKSLSPALKSRHVNQLKFLGV